ARERVLADLLRLLEDEDRLVARAALFEQPREVDRARERRRPGADEEHVDLELLALDAGEVQRRAVGSRLADGLGLAHAARLPGKSGRVGYQAGPGANKAR